MTANELVKQLNNIISCMTSGEIPLEVNDNEVDIELELLQSNEPYGYSINLKIKEK